MLTTTCVIYIIRGGKKITEVGVGRKHEMSFPGQQRSPEGKRAEIRVVKSCWDRTGKGPDARRRQDGSQDVHQHIHGRLFLSGDKV